MEVRRRKMLLSAVIAAVFGAVVVMAGTTPILGSQSGATASVGSVGSGTVGSASSLPRHGASSGTSAASSNTASSSTASSYAASSNTTSGTATRAAPSKASSTPSSEGAIAAIPGPQVASQPPRVLTVGDSIMRGFGLGMGEAWTDVMAKDDGWDLTSRACDGAGFLAIGAPEECASDFGDVVTAAASLDPQIVIVQGSSNDFGLDNAALAAATTAAIAQVRARFPSAEIIGLSTIWGDTAPPAQLADVDAQVAAAVQAVDGTFVDIGQPLENQPNLMQGDDVHPTAAGQVVLAAAIEESLDAANLRRLP